MKRVLLWLCLLLALRTPIARAQTPPPVVVSGVKIAVSGVEAVGETVGDMNRSVAFYTNVLTFTKVSDAEVTGAAYERLTGVFGLRMRVVRIKLGGETLELTQYETPLGRPVPQDSRSNDRWFQHVSIIVSDMPRAFAWLQAHGAGYVSPEPQRLPESIKGAAGIEAFYFRDPDNHTLEVLHFPPDKGDPKWHRVSPALFLGIDHTAIVVSDTEASLKFYRDTLGMRVAGGSENYGTEQEHLNNVFGARLRITSLRAASGPGIELLEYQTPHDGRPIPPDTKANDLAYWQTILRVPNAAALRAATDEMPLVSPGAVTLPDDTLGFRHAVTVRDPDNHVLELTQP